MIKKNEVTEEGFNSLLAWLNDDHETAGHLYEEIRRRLMRLYAGRGCYEAEALADEAINRVTLKLPQLIETYRGDPKLYFFGVADNVYREWLRKQKKVESLSAVDNEKQIKQEPNIEFDCLEQCLEKLPIVQRELIVDYYREDKSAKIDHRQALAKKSGVSANGLQIKAHRIRKILKECIDKCISKIK